LFVVLPEDHALSAWEELAWADLRNEHWIVRQSVNPSCLNGSPRDSPMLGTVPVCKSLKSPRDIDESRVDRVWHQPHQRGGHRDILSKIVFRPIAGDDELLHFNAVWLAHNDNPALRRFLALARTMARERRGAADRSDGPQIPPSVPVGISLWLASSLGALVRRLDLTT